MRRQYPNLRFVACANSIRELRKTGAAVLMITVVHSRNAELHRFVSRLRDGWRYRKIDERSVS
jgi:hypothetical protein